MDLYTYQQMTTYPAIHGPETVVSDIAATPLPEEMSLPTETELASAIVQDPPEDEVPALFDIIHPALFLGDANSGSQHHNVHCSSSPTDEVSSEVANILFQAEWTDTREAIKKLQELDLKPITVDEVPLNRKARQITLWGISNAGTQRLVTIDRKHRVYGRDSTALPTRAWGTWLDQSYEDDCLKHLEEGSSLVSSSGRTGRAPVISRLRIIANSIYVSFQKDLQVGITAGEAPLMTSSQLASLSEAFAYEKAEGDDNCDILGLKRASTRGRKRMLAQRNAPASSSRLH